MLYPFIGGTGSGIIARLKTVSGDDVHTQASNAAALSFTDSAATKVAEIIASEGKGPLMLRVYIQGGGCSGFQYGFTLDETENDDDTIIEKAGVRLLVDPLSIQYLAGAELDYREDLQGARFVITNPNASTTCGCGSSFGI
jgi:iron-sulfur cluster insertion protein